MAEPELKVGSLVPEFKLMANNGEEVSLSSYHGKKVVLFFVREFE
jgi:peroxiredoxin